MKITQLNYYPIKSCGGISVDSAIINYKGLEWDRRWMLIDEFNRMISQRQHPILSQVRVREQPHVFAISYQGGPEIFLNKSPEVFGQVRAKIWDDEPDLYLMHKEFHQWFSDLIQKPCRLVFSANNSMRKIRPYSALADGGYALVISQESVDYLNTLLAPEGLKVTTKNFRPNIVIEGGGMHIEDDWVEKEVQFGDNLFTGERLCGRCDVITVDPELSIKYPVITKVLAGYRARKEPKPGVYFGLYLMTSDFYKRINIGDEVSALRELVLE